MYTQALTTAVIEGWRSLLYRCTECLYLYASPYYGRDRGMEVIVIQVYGVSVYTQALTTAVIEGWRSLLYRCTECLYVYASPYYGRDRGMEVIVIQVYGVSVSIHKPLLRP